MRDACETRQQIEATSMSRHGRTCAGEGKTGETRQAEIAGAKRNETRQEHQQEADGASVEGRVAGTEADKAEETAEVGPLLQ